jgi:hypothetical protein
MKKQTAASKKVKRTPQIMPRGWSQKRVRELARYYDTQTDEEGSAEYEAAMELQDMTMMLVPRDLVPEIRRLIARRRGA